MKLNVYKSIRNRVIQWEREEREETYLRLTNQRFFSIIISILSVLRFSNRRVLELTLVGLSLAIAGETNSSG